MCHSCALLHVLHIFIFTDRPSLAQRIVNLHDMLPVEQGGKGVGVVVISTEHTLDPLTLDQIRRRQMMQRMSPVRTAAGIQRRRF
mgnify:CR=1 FL=1